MQLKIWHKMIIGIAIPSLIAIIGGVLTYGYIKDVKKRQGLVLIADDLKEQVLEVRRNEKNFLHFQNAEYFKNVTNAISVLTNSINNIPSDNVQKIGKEDFFLLNESIQTYSASVDDLYKNYLQETEDVERVRIEGRKLEAFAETGKHAKELSINFILNLRRLEKNYMLFRDKKSLITLKIALSQIKEITPFCYGCLPYIEAIQNLFTIYKKSDSILNNLQNTGNKLEEITGEIADRERKQISSFFTLTQWLLLATLLLLCTLGPLFTYKTATYIVAPIKRLAEITNKISEGDVMLRAPLKEHDETYSLAISFNTMLDHLQLTQESLEKSLELLQNKQEQLVEAEKLASLGKFAVGVAHEINNPLAIINEKTGLMKDLIDMSDDFPLKNKLLDTLNGISDSINRCRTITHRALGFARRTDASPENININNLLKEVMGFLEKEFFYKSIQLKFNPSEDLPEFESDRTQLQQVFLNIIKNAIDAVEDGGIIKVSSRLKNNDTIQVLVRDNGHGIPENIIDNIFDPFFSTKAKGKGTGLGLSITYGIIKRLGGDIFVDSNVNKGTTFFVDIPMNYPAVELRGISPPLMGGE